jgi:uncharacterized phage protein (TIGR02218 family)
MKRTGATLLAHLAQAYQTTCQCARVYRAADGQTLRFTEHDKAIVISGWAGDDAELNGTYDPIAGLGATDIATDASLAVANLEVKTAQVAPAILEADLAAGLWDAARVKVFLVNWADLTMGPHYLRTGRLGEMVAELGTVKQEILGLAQAYTRTICELTSPACRAKLGDARCTVDLGPFTFSGTVASVNADGITFYDGGLTQDGPGGGVAITGITNANPCVITMADGSLNLAEGQPITLSAIVGMPRLNQVTVAHSPGGATFQLDLDTTDTALWGTYASGGTVTPYGGGSGYFDHGLVTWTSGANVGRSMEIKAYVPGQVTLQLPMPHAIAIGDTYSIVAGCDKTLPTCRDRFDNVVNMRAEPYIPGMDQLLQVGRSGA